MVNLVTVKDRELIKVGKYGISTGEFEATPELIAATIKAHEAGVLRKPTVRLGHNDPRFSGDPAVGWVDNLRAADDGQKLIGDLVGVPEWLSDIMPSAYPSLSIEGMYDYTAPDGSQHDFILTGLALLGATPPGIGSLKSVQELYEVAAAREIGGTAITFTVEASAAPQKETASAVETGKDAVMASLKDELVKRLGLDDSADEDAIVKAFAEKYPEAPAVGATAPAAPPTPESPAPAVVGGGGVAAAAPTPGIVQLSAGQYDELMAKAEAGVRAEQHQIAAQREAVVMAAIKDGRITPASKADWIKALEVDPGGHNDKALASLKPGLIPVTEHGHGVSDESDPVNVEMENTFNRVMAAAGYSVKKGAN
ncbi:Mu-like prophage I protein [Mycobacteroides abscessus subsp. abscessus]|nr:Mu-like prophage I protein [Mycobacteroides abscessus subsp. abscessus]SKU57773.1 Mu-like prophage I protein [Mycobacteroides abscessus subsp. abscessus]